MKDGALISNLPSRTYTTHSECSVSLSCPMRPIRISENWLISSIWPIDSRKSVSLGRTDLPGGDYSWIMRSILDSLIPLGEEVHIYPGHGPESTIGHETLYNPFIVEVLNEEINYRN